MSSRNFIKKEGLLPLDVVSMVIELLPKISTTDIQFLIMHCEEEIDERRYQDSLIDEEDDFND